jgi:predicted Ser/Thr protein kinase
LTINTTFGCLVSHNIQKESRIAFNELVVEKEIGKGSYGQVFVGKWNDAKVALKFCRNKGNIENFMTECKIMM